MVWAFLTPQIFLDVQKFLTSQIFLVVQIFLNTHIFLTRNFLPKKFWLSKYFWLSPLTDHTVFLMTIGIFGSRIFVTMSDFSYTLTCPGCGCPMPTSLWFTAVDQHDDDHGYVCCSTCITTSRNGRESAWSNNNVWTHPRSGWAIQKRSGKFH